METLLPMHTLHLEKAGAEDGDVAGGREGGPAVRLLKAKGDRERGIMFNALH